MLISVNEIITNERKIGKLTLEDNKLKLAYENKIQELESKEIEGIFKDFEMDFLLAEVYGKTINIFESFPLALTTYYSIGNSLLSIEEIIELNYPAIGIIENNNLYASRVFIKKMKEKNKIPIVGSSFWVKNSQKSKEYEIKLIAKNQIGYMNLCKILNLKKKYLIESDLENHSEGLIALTGKNGNVYKMIKNKNVSVINTIEWYKSIYEDIYFEVDNTMNINEVFEIAQVVYQRNVKCVATNTGKYLNYTRDNLLALGLIKSLSNEKTEREIFSYYNTQNDEHLLTQEEIENKYKMAQSILFNCYEILKKCEEFFLETNSIKKNQDKYNKIKEKYLSTSVNSDFSEVIKEEFNLIEDNKKEILVEISEDIFSYIKSQKRIALYKGEINYSYLFSMINDTLRYKYRKLQKVDKLLLQNLNKINIIVPKNIDEELIDYLLNNYNQYNIKKFIVDKKFKLNMYNEKIELILKSNYNLYNNGILINAVSILDNKPIEYKESEEYIIYSPEDILPFDKDLIMILTDKCTIPDFYYFNMIPDNILEAISLTLNELYINIDNIKLDSNVFNVIKSNLTYKIYNLDGSFNNQEQILFLPNDKDILYINLRNLIALNANGNLNELNKYINYFNNFINNQPFQLEPEFHSLNETLGVLIYKEQLKDILYKILNTVKDIDIELIFNKIINNSFSIKEKEQIFSSIDNDKKNKLNYILNYVDQLHGNICSKIEIEINTWVTYINIFIIYNCSAVYYKNVLNNLPKEEVYLSFNALKNFLQIEQPCVKESDLYFKVTPYGTLKVGLNNIQGVELKEKPQFEGDIQKFISINKIDEITYEKLVLSGALDIYQVSVEELIKNKGYLFDNNSEIKFTDVYSELNQLTLYEENKIKKMKNISHSIYHEKDINVNFLRNTTLISEIKANKESYVEKGIRVLTAGKVTDIEEKQNKSGNGSTLYITLEYLNNSLKTKIFSSNESIYIKAKNLKLYDNIYIDGVVSIYKDNLSAIINNFLYINEFHRGFKKLFVIKENKELFEVLKSYEVNEENLVSLDNVITVYFDGEKKFKVPYCYKLEIELLKYINYINIF